ncbi:MAG: hypothetical protein AAFY59_19300, partial [Pseudomonadota bacterium]
MIKRCLLALSAAFLLFSTASAEPPMTDEQFADIRALATAFHAHNGAPEGQDPYGLPPGITTLEEAANRFGLTPAQLSEGTLQSAYDIGFMIRQQERDAPGSMADLLAAIRAKTGKPLDEIIEHEADVAARVLARGQIDTLTEYYVI